MHKIKLLMIIYNVTIKVSHGIVTPWLKWMQEEHIADMMATGMFVGYRMCKLEEVTDDEGETYVIQYECLTEENYNYYIDHLSENMRKKGFDLFGNLYMGFRTKMTVLSKG